MKRSDLKIGESYAIASTGSERHRFFARVGILLDSDIHTYGGSFDYRVGRATIDRKTGKSTANALLFLKEAFMGENRVSRAEAAKFKPSTEWMDRWFAIRGNRWPSAEQRAEHAKLEADIPSGWRIEAETATRVWMPWSEFVAKRKQFEEAENARQAERAERARSQADAARLLASDASLAGIKRFSVSQDGTKITLDAEDFRNLVSGGLRATV